MPYEVKIGDRTANVELLSRNNEQVLILIDGKEYALDYVQVGPGRYSALLQNKSYNIEIIPGSGIREYQVSSIKNTYTVQIIDAEAKYLASRNKGADEDAEATILAPIPGKVVRIPISVGDFVEAGQTVAIMSAMKMESEFKAKKAGKIIDVPVSEGQTVDARQVLVVMEFSSESQANS